MCLPCVLNILHTELHTIFKQNVQDSSLNICHPTTAPLVLALSPPPQEKRKKKVLDASMGKLY